MTSKSSMASREARCPATFRVAWSHRDIPPSYDRHITGQLTFRPHQNVVPFESRLEQRMVEFIADCPDVTGLFSQPFTLFLEVRGRRFRYTPDLLVVLEPVCRSLARLGFEHWTVVEVKPESEWLDLQALIHGRLAAVRAVLGMAAVCLTERDLPRRYLS